MCARVLVQWRWGYGHAEDGGTASDVKDDLVLEEVGVLVNGIAVALGSDFIFLETQR